MDQQVNPFIAVMVILALVVFSFQMAASYRAFKMMQEKREAANKLFASIREETKLMCERDDATIAEAKERGMKDTRELEKSLAARRLQHVQRMNAVMLAEYAAVTSK